MAIQLNNVIGERGERIVELCLTDYKDFEQPLFRPSFLGEKWPAIDFYVELTTIPNKRLYFFGQVKTTTGLLSDTDEKLCIHSTAENIQHLLQTPAPTYIFAVHEPSQRVFIRSVYQGVKAQAITQIPIKYELTSSNLKKLNEEVSNYWNTHQHKPTFSVFS